MSSHVGSNPTPSATLIRRGVRVAEGARLEIVYTSKRRVEGSNPSLSAQSNRRSSATFRVALLFCSDGRRVLSGSHDQTVRLWDVESGHELCSFGGHTAAVTSIAISPDGTLAVSASLDRTLRVWQLPA